MSDDLWHVGHVAKIECEHPRDERERERNKRICLLRTAYKVRAPTLSDRRPAIDPVTSPHSGGHKNGECLPDPLPFAAAMDATQTAIAILPDNAQSRLNEITWYANKLYDVLELPVISE